MSTATKLQSILDSKASIKQALINRGYKSEEVGDILSQYGYLIENISTGGGELETAISDAKYDYIKEYLIDMIAESYEITKDWVDYSQAKGTDIWFLPVLGDATVSVILSAFEDCKRLLFFPNQFKSSSGYLSTYFKNCIRLLFVDFSEGFFDKFDRYMSMLEGCKSLKYVKNFVFKNAASNGIFLNCNLLEEISGRFESPSPNYFYLFNNCNSLKKITGFEFDFSAILAYSGIQGMFAGCNSLEEVRFKENSLSTTNLDLTSCKLLSHDSLLSILNSCAQTSETKTLKLGADNLAKLSEEEKAIATNKGWTLA